MRITTINPSTLILTASVGIVAAGGSWAAAVAFKEPAASGPDPAKIVALASASQIDLASSQVPDPLAHSRAERPAPAAPPAARPAPAPAPAIEPRRAPVPMPSPTPDNPTQNVALVGITRDSEGEQAWLVDTSTRERETVPVGGTVFGFTVRSVGEETVTLARNNREFVIRLGEKDVPGEVLASSESGTGGGEGPGGEGRGPFGGFDPSRMGDMRSRMSEFRERMAGFSGDFGRSSRDYSGRSSDYSSRGPSSYGGSRYSSGSSSFSRGGDRGGDSSRSSSRSSGSGISFGGPGMFMGGSGYSSRNYGSTGSSSQSTSTSNPQTANRTGARLTGSLSDAIEQPETISNPQTQRRRGSSSGTAFGSQTTSGYGSLGGGSSRSTGSTTFSTTNRGR